MLHTPITTVDAMGEHDEMGRASSEVEKEERERKARMRMRMRMVAR